MKKLLYAAISLLILSSGLTNSLQAQNALCYPYFVSDDREQLLSDIETWYEAHFSRPDFYTTYQAMGMITSFIDNLNPIKSQNGDCDPGELRATGKSTSTPFKHDFRWQQGVVFTAEYNSHVLDLRLNPRSTQIENTPGGVSIASEDPNIGKLMAFNVTCPSSDESSFYIIIIDRDIGIAEINSLCYASVEATPPPANDMQITPTPLPRLAAGSTTLTLHPNPAIDGNTQLNLSYKEDGLATLQVISASTGKIAATLFTAEKLTRGDHQYNIDTDRLSSGMYYVQLKTAERSIVQRLIKL